MKFDFRNWVIPLMILLLFYAGCTSSAGSDWLCRHKICQLVFKNTATVWETERYWYSFFFISLRVLAFRECTLFVQVCAKFFQC